MAGKLYGVGIGPGDPELITLKAIRAIERCPVLAAPETGVSRTVALDIVRKLSDSGIVADLEKKELLSLKIPMTRDPNATEINRDRVAEQVAKLLEQGKDVAFLTLGDPSIYSTYLYTHKRVLAKGLAAEMIPGVPSFCAVAARLNTGLAENAQALHIIPASYEGTAEALDLKGTKVLMKTGKQLEAVKQMLKQKGLYEKTCIVQNCGMAGEAVFDNLDQADNRSSYFSILLVADEDSFSGKVEI